MSQDIFDARINRITTRTHLKRSDMAEGEGVSAPMFSSPLPDVPSARRFYKTILMGLVMGAIVGVLAGGLEDPLAAWGPGTTQHPKLVLPVTLGFMLSPFFAMLGVMVQERYPSLFYFAAAYFPAVLTASLL